MGEVGMQRQSGARDEGLHDLHARVRLQLAKSPQQRRHLPGRQHPAQLPHPRLQRTSQSSRSTRIPRREGFGAYIDQMLLLQEYGTTHPLAAKAWPQDLLSSGRGNQTNVVPAPA